MTFAYNPFIDNLDFKDAAGPGTGDVVGPGSSIDGDIVLFDGTTGLLIKDSGVGLPLPVGSGGTGLSTTPTNGKLLIGNGTNYTLANLTAGANMSITNGAGTITLAASGGTGVS